MPRRNSGRRRVTFQPFAHFRRLAFTRLEDRHMLSALGLEIALPPTAADHAPGKQEDHHQPPVAAIAADHDHGTKSPPGQDKAAHPVFGEAIPRGHAFGHAVAKDRDNKADHPKQKDEPEPANPVPAQVLPVHNVLPILDSVAASDLEPELSEHVETSRADTLPTIGSPNDEGSAFETTQVFHASYTPTVSNSDGASETATTDLSGQKTSEGSVAADEQDVGEVVARDLPSVTTRNLPRDSRPVAAVPLTASMPAMPETQGEAEEAGDANGETAALAAAIAVADGNAAADGSAPSVSSAVPSQAAAHDDSSPGLWPPGLLRAVASEPIARAKEASYGDVIQWLVDEVAPRGTQASDYRSSPERTVDRQPMGEAVADAVFASFSGHEGSFTAWLEFYALPRNLVSLHKAIQTLLAECEDADEVIADWLLEPGVQPWLEWAAVALIAAEAARRAAGRQKKRRAGDLEGQQLLHLFPELFGLAYGVR